MRARPRFWMDCMKPEIEKQTSTTVDKSVDGGTSLKSWHVLLFGKGKQM